MERELVTSPKLFMFPWLAYGHIYAFLEVAKKLSERGFSIYLCSTSVNLDSIKKKITADEYSHSIQLVEIRLPDLPELPSSYHTANGLPPHLMATLKKALHAAKPELSNILKTLKPDLVVYDMVQTWAGALCARHNIPAVKFLTTGTVMLAYFGHMGISIASGREFPSPAIRLNNFHRAIVRKISESLTKDVQDQDPEDKLPGRYCDRITVIKDSPGFNEKYINYCSDILKYKVVPVCPLLQDSVGEDQDDDELIQWLGNKGENSSVFVAFGSEYFLTKEEIEEVALGLELSNANFLWVLRFPKGTTMRIEAALPEGFLERVKGRGRIVEGWAPQTKILRHPSIGGFVSHCGWNSTIESISIGVPIIAMPMNLDQPFNAVFAVELGVGVEVTAEENGTRKRETIAEVIKDVVVGRTGENLRTRARAIGEKLKARENEDFDELESVLKQLCQDNNLQN